MAARVVSPGTAARLRDERGQAVVITAVFLVALLGMAALAVDLGAWSRSQRALQARVDAAALAGAQALPYDTDTATSLAGEDASKNGDRSQASRSRSGRRRTRTTRSRSRRTISRRASLRRRSAFRA